MVPGGGGEMVPGEGMVPVGYDPMGYGPRGRCRVAPYLYISKCVWAIYVDKF